MNRLVYITFIKNEALRRPTSSFVIVWEAQLEQFGGQAEGSRTLQRFSVVCQDAELQAIRAVCSSKDVQL